MTHPTDKELEAMAIRIGFAECAAMLRACKGCAMKVRPLDWEDHPACDGPVLAKAVTLLGTYFIVDDTDDFSGLYLDLISHDDARWWQSVRSTSTHIEEGWHGDVQPLKDKAQADYERRILSALEPAPDARQEAWNAGIEAAATYVASMDSSMDSTFELYHTIHIASDQCASAAENREQALKILAEIAAAIRTLKKGPTDD